MKKVEFSCGANIRELNEGNVVLSSLNIDGETWYIYEDYVPNEGVVGYWLCREKLSDEEFSSLIRKNSNPSYFKVLFIQATASRSVL